MWDCSFSPFSFQDCCLLTLFSFQDWIIGYSVALRTSSLSKQVRGLDVFSRLVTQKVYAWAELHAVEVSGRCIPDKNIVADQLSPQDQVILMEWFLLLQVVSQTCQICGRPMIDLFTTRGNHKFLIYGSPVSDPMA